MHFEVFPGIGSGFRRHGLVALGVGVRLNPSFVHGPLPITQACGALAGYLLVFDWVAALCTLFPGAMTGFFL